MEHDIVFDLLPLYHDGVCSAASRAAGEEHLKGCETCRQALSEMDAPLPAAEEQKNAADGAAVPDEQGTAGNDVHVSRRVILIAHLPQVLFIVYEQVEGQLPVCPV